MSREKYTNKIAKDGPSNVDLLLFLLYGNIALKLVNKPHKASSGLDEILGTIHSNSQDRSIFYPEHTHAVEAIDREVLGDVKAKMQMHGEEESQKEGLKEFDNLENEYVIVDEVNNHIYSGFYKHPICNENSRIISDQEVSIYDDYIE
ncbi:MAG: hypothetical protein SFT91_03900 [Rickettsiaceae bacterium]|nr:hypothetical protein [Rickettsiaceae bacterium]